MTKRITKEETLRVDYDYEKFKNTFDKEMEKLEKEYPDIETFMKKKMKKILDKILTFDVYHIVVAQLSELCMFKFDWNTKRKIN